MYIQSLYIDILLLIFILITGHISPAILFFNFPLTAFPLLLLIPIVYFRYKKEFSFVVFERIFLLLFSASILFLFSSGTSLYFNHIKHILQTLFSFLAGFSLFVLYKKIEKKNKLKKVILYLILFLIFLGLLERFVPFYKNYASQINQIFQSGNRYLLADRITDINRSISFLGFERPLVFSPENAVLGRTIFCLSSSLIILFEKFKERIIFAIFIAFTFFLFGSPMCLFFLPTALISELFLKNEFQFKFYRIKILYILSLLMGSLLVSYNFLRIRIESFLSLINSQILPFSFLRENSSEYLRLVLPIQSLREILNENPFFGIGFGAHNYLQELFFGRTIYGAEAFNGNNFLYPLFSFGLFGTTIFILIIKSNFPKKFDNLLPILPFLIFYSNYSGGFPEPRFWIFFFSILSSGYLKSLKNK